MAREKRHLEREESELSLFCYRFMGLIQLFFIFIGIKGVASSSNNSTRLQGGCYSDKCSSVWKTQVECSTAEERGALSVREECLLCPVGDSSTLLQGWKGFCCLHIVMNRKKKKSSIDPNSQLCFDRYPKSSICARIQCPLT